MIYILAPTMQRALEHVRYDLEPEFERHIAQREYLVLTPLTYDALRGRRLEPGDMVIELKGWDIGKAHAARESYRHMLALADLDTRNQIEIRWR